MATLASNLITKQMSWTANMTDQNQLGASLHARPHVFGPMMDQLFSAKNYYSDNPLSSKLFGKEAMIGGTEFEWELRGANTRPLVIIEDIESSNTTKGQYNAEFSIKLDENWFLPTDVLQPGNKRYLCRVMTHPQQHGSGWVYRMRLVSNDQQAFLPQEYVKPGTKWSKLYSSTSEATEERGSTQFALPIALRNKIGKIGKQYKITDYAATEVLAVGMIDSKNRKHMSWMKYAEVEFWQQWYREKERALWYSRSSDNIIGANGRPVRTFPGLQEQLEDSHQHYYTHLTAKLIEEFLMDIFYSRLKPGAGRKIVGYTGEYGMIHFHRAIQDVAQKNGFLQVVDIASNFIGKESSPYHSNALGFGYQFTRYKMANGIELEMVWNPLYDDREINYDIDPITGRPIESQRITFLDFSGGKDDNIQIVKKEKGSYFTYIPGTIGPYGPSNGGVGSHAGDYYEMVVGDSFGLKVTDITRCGELLLARQS